MNPRVFELLVKQVDKAILKGKKRISVKTILGYIRWEIFLEIKQESLFDKKGDKIEYKIPDQFTSRFSRLLVDKYPYMKSYIEQRSIRSL
jgi:hypothetical protein